MKQNNIKHITILLLSFFLFLSCGAKKKVFNGTETLNCPTHDQKTSKKKNSKWRLVLYKDGEVVGEKSKKGKSRLFKKKQLNKK